MHIGGLVKRLLYESEPISIIANGNTAFPLLLTEIQRFGDIAQTTKFKRCYLVLL